MRAELSQIGGKNRMRVHLNFGAKSLAEQDQASLNQFITVAVAEKVSALQTAEFFTQRAGNAKSEDLMRFLANVKNRLPMDGDELIS